MKIENLEDIINHFIAGNKNEKNIGIENEKFIFDKNNKNRSNYEQICKVLQYLHKNFGWNKVMENKNNATYSVNVDAYDNKRYNLTWVLEKASISQDCKNCWMTTSVTQPQFIGQLN